MSLSFLMTIPWLPPEDLPLNAKNNGHLQHKLEATTSEFFYDACDQKTQALLSACEWYITTRASALTLVIVCPDGVTNWRVLDHIVNICKYLEPLSKTAKIRVYPPVGQGSPIEIRIDEINVFQDSYSPKL